MKTILVPIDLSPAAAPVIASAAALAQGLAAEIVLLHVVQPAVGVVDYAVVALNVARVDESTVHAAQQRLAEEAQRLKALKLRVRTLHVTGVPAEGILSQAQALRADYIVIGSHGHSAVYDLFVGSTTSVVLKHAHCPVVVVGVRDRPTGATHVQPEADHELGIP